MVAHGKKPADETDPLAALGPEGEKELKAQRARNRLIWTILAVLIGVIYGVFSR